MILKIIIDGADQEIRSRASRGAIYNSSAYVPHRPAKRTDQEIVGHRVGAEGHRRLVAHSVARLRGQY